MTSTTTPEPSHNDGSINKEDLIGASIGFTIFYIVLMPNAYVLIREVLIGPLIGAGAVCEIKFSFRSVSNNSMWRKGNLHSLNLSSFLFSRQALIYDSLWIAFCVALIIGGAIGLGTGEADSANKKGMLIAMISGQMFTLPGKAGKMSII